MAGHWRTIWSVHVNLGVRVERTTLQQDLLGSNGKAKPEPAAIVAEFEVHRAGNGWVDLKGQRIPTPFVRELQLGAHREDGAGADEKR